MKNTVRDTRKDVGMTVSELARRAKTSRQTIYAIEKQEIKNVSGEVMFRIADALRKPEREIFFARDVIHEDQSA